MDTRNIDAEIDMPSGHIRTLPLVLTVYDMNDTVIKRENLDYGSKTDRSLIGRISLWALQNHMVVEVVAKADYRE